MRRFLFFSSIVLISAAGLVAAVDCGPPPPILPDLVTIHGQVVAGGVGVPNAIVYGFDEIAAEAGVDSGKPVSQLADGTGHFFFYGYGSTYETLVAPPGSPNDLTLVRGLTRRDPAIAIPLPANAPVHSCSLSPTWTPPPPSGSKIAYIISGPTYQGVQLVGVSQAGSDPNGPIVATWRGGESTTAVLSAFVYTPDSNGAPATWLGYAQSYTWLLDGHVQGISPAFQATGTSLTTIDIQPPDGFTVANATLGADFGALTTGLTFYEIASPQGTQSFQMPDVPNNRLVSRANATNGGASTTAFAFESAQQNRTSAMTIDMPAPPALTSPNDGATIDAASTAFSLQGSTSITGPTVQEITFTPADASAPKIRIVTTETTVTLADVEMLSGATVPGGARYSWQARQFHDFGTTDQFEDPNVDLSTATVMTSAPRTFTNASP